MKAGGIFFTKSDGNHYSSLSSVEIGRLAQLVEQQFEELYVAGSNPASTIKQKSTVANKEKCLNSLR